MSCINNTTKTKQKQYHHLTENDRAKIQSLVEQKDEKEKRLFNNTYIANYIAFYDFRTIKTITMCITTTKGRFCNFVAINI